MKKLLRRFWSLPVGDNPDRSNKWGVTGIGAVCLYFAARIPYDTFVVHSSAQPPDGDGYDIMISVILGVIGITASVAAAKLWLGK